MSVSELTEGLKKKVASLGIANPSVKPSVCQLPVKGSLLVGDSKNKQKGGTVSRPLLIGTVFTSSRIR